MRVITSNNIAHVGKPLLGGRVAVYQDGAGRLVAIDVSRVWKWLAAALIGMAAFAAAGLAAAVWAVWWWLS